MDFFVVAVFKIHPPYCIANFRKILLRNVVYHEPHKKTMLLCSPAAERPEQKSSNPTSLPK